MHTHYRNQQHAHAVFINIPLQTRHDRPSFAGCRPALVSAAEVVALTTSDSRVTLSVSSLICSRACWTVMLSSTLQLKCTEKPCVHTRNYLTKGVKPFSSHWHLLHLMLHYLVLDLRPDLNSWKSSSIKAKIFREFCFQ